LKGWPLVAPFITTLVASTAVDPCVWIAGASYSIESYFWLPLARACRY
jgi:hypothetical protein